ncbi:MAG: hypothetical protein Q9M43_06760 [Sulfurimonas sp.]|nr:hypothetical protein [Sulfurimonas sp.]
MNTSIPKRRWINQEVEMLSSLLVDGIELEVLKRKSLLQRSEAAIIKRCQTMGYSVKTINGVQVFRSGIKKKKHKR